MLIFVQIFVCPINSHSLSHAKCLCLSDVQTQLMHENSTKKKRMFSVHFHIFVNLANSIGPLRAVTFFFSNNLNNIITRLLIDRLLWIKNTENCNKKNW